MLKNFENFFKEKRILITGHTGFIGSWLSILCKELGADVIGYELKPNTRDDNFVVTNLEDKITSIIGDVRNYKKLNKIFKRYNPEITFHLAAQPIVGESYKFPRRTYDINLNGTINIFEIFRKNLKCKLLLNFTTDKVYENKELASGYKESDPLGGYDPYSSSKACSELITSAYRNSFFNTNPNNEKKVSSLRCGNIIGGGDWQKYRIIPDCMRAIQNNKEIRIRHPNYIRPWQLVLEPLRGLLILTKHMWENNSESCDAWNFGPNPKELYSVKTIVDKILQYYNKDDYKINIVERNEEFHETQLLLLDSSKAYQYLGWKPVLDIDTTLKFVCDWYKEVNINYAFNVKQIKDYFKKIKNIKN
jgi:CDP-glucose 4,6-dehydratase